MTEEIHKEAKAVFCSDRMWIDPPSLNALELADSAIRETLRLSPLLLRSNIREVVRAEGVITPDGHHVPSGTWLGVAIENVHCDIRYYDNPEIYNAFRFTTGNAQGSTSSRPGDAVHSLTTMSQVYLPWGYGRHAW